MLFAVLAAGWLISFFVQPFNGQISDFPQYYAPARLICSGHGSDAYNFAAAAKMQQSSFVGMGTRFVPTYLPPSALFWFLPFGLLSGQYAFILWKIVQFLSMVGAILLLRKTFNLNRKALCYLIAGICASGPAFAATQLGQISMPILLALSSLIWAIRNDRIWLAAVAISILMLKPQEGLPLLVFMAGAKRYKLISYSVVVLLASFLIVACLTGSQGMSDYLSSLNSGIQKDQTILMQPELGPTIRGQLLRIAPDSKSVISLVSGAAMLLSWLFIFLSGKKFAARPSWLEAGLLIAVPLGLLTAFHFHSYDLTLLAPPLVLVMAGPLESAMPPWLLLGGFLVVGVFMVPFYMYIHWNYLLQEHWILNPHFFALMALSAGLIYLAYRYPDKLVKNSGNTMDEQIDAASDKQTDKTVNKQIDTALDEPTDSVSES